jgi:hypothetical protein
VLRHSTPALTAAAWEARATAANPLEQGLAAGEPASWPRRRGGEIKVEAIGCRHQPPTKHARVLLEPFDCGGGHSKSSARLPQDRWGTELPRLQIDVLGCGL